AVRTAGPGTHMRNVNCEPPYLESVRVACGKEASMAARRRATLVAAVRIAALAGPLVAGPSAVQREPLAVDVDGTVTLDGALYLPAGASADDPRPAVLLAHGFLGDRTSMDDHARTIADQGYVVVTWSSRGFGRSGGEVGLAAPDAEIADVRVL